MKPGRPLNLLVVTNDLLVGGVQRNVVRYFRYFDTEHFRLHLVTVCAGGPLEKEILETGATYAHVRSIAGLGPAKTISPFGVRKLAGLMQKWEIDVCQTRLFLGNTIGRAAALLAGVPVIVAAEHSTYFSKTPVHCAIDRFLAKRTGPIVAVSQVVAEFTARQESFAPDKFRVIHNGLDLERFEMESCRDRIREEFSIPAEAFVVGSVSRLIEEKDFHRFVSYLPAIADKVENLRFLLVGDGPHLQAIKNAAKKAGASDLCIFTGERDDVPEMLSAMDLFCLPSKREGLPTAVLEAMAAGVPVLTNDLPQFREIVTDGLDGVVVNCGSEPAVVDAVIRLHNDPKIRKQMAQAGRKRVHDFSIQKMVDGYAKLYLELFEKLP